MSTALTHPNFLKLPESEQTLIKGLVELGEKAEICEIIAHVEIPIPKIDRHVAIILSKVEENEYRVGTVIPVGKVISAHYDCVLEAILNFETMKKELIEHVRRL